MNNSWYEKSQQELGKRLRAEGEFWFINSYGEAAENDVLKKSFDITRAAQVSVKVKDPTRSFGLVMITGTDQFYEDLDLPDNFSSKEMDELKAFIELRRLPKQPI